MRPIKVGIIGLGTIGRRLSDAVRLQPDMTLVGVGVRRRTPFVLAAEQKGVAVFLTGAGDGADAAPGGFGQLERLLAACDVVADARQAGLGAGWVGRYRSAGVKVVFQGGEARSAVELTYNSFVNFEEATGKGVVRVTSCNTTGLARLLTTLHREFGVARADAVLMRCSTDPDKAANGLVNGAAPTFGESHHGEDLRAIAPDIPVYSQAVAFPMSFSHVQGLTIHLHRAPSREALVGLLGRTPRIVLGDRTQGATTGELALHYAYRCRPVRPRGDRPELLVWADSVVCRGNVVKLITSVDMQAITIPDTIDCLRALFAQGLSRADCLRLTDETLGLARAGARYESAGLECAAEVQRL